MNLNHSTNKANGDQLTATEWNNLAADVNELGAGGGNGSSIADTHISKSEKGNIEFITTVEDQVNGKGGKINIESYSDIQVKPGDDVIFTSSHRPIKNMDEVSMKVHDGEDHPVKLQLNAADIVLTTKDKGLTMTKDATTGEDTETAMYDDPNVMNITVNSAKNTRGYLKVRAQAIDLRSESHGGIALQPKGFDSDNHMNKIKFEHGGGDGLEFGTFNTEHTSLFTGDYRFNKDGVIRLATRQTEASDKADATDATTANKYVKQADDFYDIIAAGDPTCTWEDIVTYIAWAKSNNQGPWTVAA